MAKQKRKPAAQPTSIIRHPLFPAVVALWFGALFGLGSLAIRTGLFESFVLMTHIDTLVPAAAPPLGVTAKICIALAMAVLGGMLGAKLAKFLTRPNPDAHQRKRGASSVVESDARRRDAHPDAPARRPISAHEEFGGEGIETESASATLPGRRRGLTVEEESSVFSVPEFAPLPGGELKVIDFGELDLAGSEIEAIDAAPQIAAVEMTPGHQNFAADIDAQEQRQVFGQPVVPGQPFAPPVPTHDASSEAAFSPLPIANYGAPVAPPIDFSRPGEVIAAANAARTEEAPLFQRPAVDAIATDAMHQTVAETPDSAEVISQSPAQTAISAEAVAEAAAVALDSLGLVELTERFAATLRKRRAELAASAAAIEVPVTAEPVVASHDPASALEPEGFNVPQFEVPPFSVPESAMTAEAEQAAPFAAEPALTVPSFARFGADPAPAPLAEPADEPAVPAFMPLDLAPVAPQATEAAADEPVAPLAMPAALRPVSFDDHDEDEDFATYLPLRHIPMPQVPAATEVQQSAAAAPQAFDSASDHIELAEEAVADGYSSLLDVAKPAVLRQEFVRIDEPESELAAIEPVVIFPGQAARQNFAQPAPFSQPATFASAAEVPAAAPEPAQVSEIAPLRRFDSPENAMAGQAVAAQAPAQIQDPAETERALRAALATLQRMSGAA